MVLLHYITVYHIIKLHYSRLFYLIASLLFFQYCFCYSLSISISNFLLLPLFKFCLILCCVCRFVSCLCYCIYYQFYYYYYYYCYYRYYYYYLQDFLSQKCRVRTNSSIFFCSRHLRNYVFNFVHYHYLWGRLFNITQYLFYLVIYIL